MNFKNILLITVAAITTITTIKASTETTEPSSEELRWREYFERKSKPNNSNERPTSSKTVKHDKDQTKRGGDLKRRPYKLEDARIYFDTDESGKPCYQSIADHLNINPRFKDVGLIMYHQPGIFFGEETFEKIGTMGDEKAREKFKNNIAEYKGYLSYKKKNGTWCPLQNVFIGGTELFADQRFICETYARFLEARP